ncbi:MAG TPA: STAS domain-containing protein [Blastocatellia bacterium]|nr:STAS domain-containing protein [Blastocatellia bacterium]
MAHLTINERNAGNVTILDLSGKITIGEGSVQLRDAVRKLLEQGHKNLLIDLGQVDYVDSSGIGELVSCYTTTKNQGGQLKLLNLTKKIKDLLSITKLLTVFETFESESEAVSSFGG